MARWPVESHTKSLYAALAPRWLLALAAALAPNYTRCSCGVGSELQAPCWLPRWLPRWLPHLPRWLRIADRVGSVLAPNCGRVDSALRAVLAAALAAVCLLKVAAGWQFQKPEIVLTRSNHDVMDLVRTISGFSFRVGSKLRAVTTREPGRATLKLDPIGKRARPSASQPSSHRGPTSASPTPARL
jgi:hypothetical protein